MKITAKKYNWRLFTANKEKKQIDDAGGYRPKRGAGNPWVNIAIESANRMTPYRVNPFYGTRAKRPNPPVRPPKPMLNIGKCNCRK